MEFDTEDQVLFSFSFEIINDPHTILDSINATVKTKLKNPQIYQYVFMDFLFELKKNLFYGSKFHQKKK